MPIYEYRCHENGHEFEVLQKISEPAIETCQVCGGKVNKLISSSAFHLKGGGWYVTDYKKNGSQKPKEKAETAKDTKTASGDSSQASTTSEAATTTSES